MEPRCSVSGTVESDEDPRFDRAKIRIEFTCSEGNWVSEYAEAHGVPHVCGRIDFTKNLAPTELHDVDFGAQIFAPIQAWVRLDPEQFRLIEAALSSFQATGRHAQVSLEFNSSTFEPMYMRLSRLDLSSATDYPIVGCSVVCMPSISPGDAA